MFNYINLKKEKQESPSKTKVDFSNFEDETIKITYKDYYFSNVIARSSKTMLNCNNSKSEVKRTGTEG
jgi:NADH-quinone oxidoreductase subunit G